jgi:GT2 family glycosyltransferase
MPLALDHMLAFLGEHFEVDAVGSKMLNEDRPTQSSVKSLPHLGFCPVWRALDHYPAFPKNRFSRKRLLHLDRDSARPFIARYLSGALKMMPRRIVEKVGYLDDRLFYHVDANDCKRIAEGGYKCYHLPSATVVNLNHKGGTMVSSRLRFRSLLSFPVDCYIYYRKHIQRRVFYTSLFLSA